VELQSIQTLMTVRKRGVEATLELS
jgi:hypothetical protein